MVYSIIYFLLWTLMLYWIHRLVHATPLLKNIHWDHHRYVLVSTPGWRWNNLLLFNDTWTSTIDLWITEVIPTIVFSYITGQWWICALYYVWAAFFQENLEHNKDVDFRFWTMGRWHLVHHNNSTKHFGLFIPVWDMMFKTVVKKAEIL